MSCPTLLYYTYMENDKYTAYSTDRFNYDGLLQVILTFVNNYDNPISFNTPQVWTTESVPPDPNEDPGSPVFHLVYTPQEVNPAEEFAIAGIIDLSTVKSGDKQLTIIPQLRLGGWFADVEKYAPVVSAVFTCLKNQPQKI